MRLASGAVGSNKSGFGLALEGIHDLQDWWSVRRVGQEGAVAADVRESRRPGEYPR